MGWNQGSVFPLLIVTAGGKFTGLFVYDSNAPAKSHLIASISAANGTDPYGNSFFAGIDSYSGGLAAQLNAAVLRFTSLTSAPFTTPEIETITAAATGTNLNLISGKGTAGATGVTITLWDSLASPQAVQQAVIGPVVNSVAPSTTALLEVQGAIQTTGLNSIIANGNLQSQLGDVTISAGKLNVKSAQLSTDVNGFLRMLSGLAGDTNNYFVAYTSSGGSALPQTISSTTPTTITGCSLPVGIGQYAFKARVVFQGGVAAGTANFSVSGPANTSPSINAMFIMSGGTAGAGVQNAALGPVNSPTLTVSNNIADISGEVTFTAAGTIALQCAEGTNLDTVIIEQARFWLYPIL